MNDMTQIINNLRAACEAANRAVKAAADAGCEVRFNVNHPRGWVPEVSFTLSPPEVMESAVTRAVKAGG